MALNYCELATPILGHGGLTKKRKRKKKSKVQLKKKQKEGNVQTNQY